MIRATLACEPLAAPIHKLPSESDAPAIGTALAATMARAMRPKARFWFKLKQTGNFTCFVYSRSRKSGHSGGGTLSQSFVDVAPILVRNETGRAAVGLPLTGGAEAEAGVLLLRLIEAMTAAHLHFEMDFRAAADPDKRYRLILHAASGSWLYLHAPSLERLLAGGLEFVASGPTVAHKHP
jgi:hypothetical protein